ncbi:MAG: LysR family transcriptional regulator [Pseudomonadota bacterium]
MYESKSNNGATIAMLRAFVCMSNHLQLSKTCEELGATRQTVRRHINDLERIKGGKLFEVVDRQYRLTEFGESCVDAAKALLIQFDAFSGQSPLSRTSSDSLEISRYVDVDGREFFSQQHSVSKIAMEGLPLAREALAAWGDAETRIEHPSMQAIRAYTVLYRKGPHGWVFVDVGHESAYAKWFGWAWSRSAIGKLLNEDNVGDEFNEFIAGAYSRIYDEGGVRLDHVYAFLPKDGGEPLPVTFQRLLLGCVFPDGTPGLTVLALITNNVEIDAIKDRGPLDLPSEVVMDSLSSTSHPMARGPRRISA